MPIKEIYWVPAVEAVCLMGVCIYLLRKYADMDRTNGFVITIVVLGWYMAFSMIFAIPLDIYIVSKLFINFCCRPPLQDKQVNLWFGGGTFTFMAATPSIGPSTPSSWATKNQAISQLKADRCILSGITYHGTCFTWEFSVSLVEFFASLLGGKATRVGVFRVCLESSLVWIWHSACCGLHWWLGMAWSKSRSTAGRIQICSTSSHTSDAKLLSARTNWSKLWQKEVRTYSNWSFVSKTFKSNLNMLNTKLSSCKMWTLH